MKTKKKLGKIVQISATREDVFALTDTGIVFKYSPQGCSNDREEWDGWEPLSDLTSDNVVVPGDEEDDEESD